MGTTHAVRLAGRDDVDAMAAALALAFHDDPVMCWLFGDVPPRPIRYLRPFFAAEARRHLRHANVYTTPDQAGAAYWDPPGHWKTPPAHLVRSTPLLLRGLRGRTLKALRGLTRMEAVHARQPPHHYYLAVLGTRPDRRGLGVGSALLAPVLDTCDREGVGAYLESSKATNVPYYERHGFTVVDEVELPGGPTVWPMWRDPRPPDPST